MNTDFINTVRKKLKTAYEARALIRYLIKQGKDWHYEDDANECGFTKLEAYYLNRRADELYQFNWGRWECPIGYALEHHKKKGDI